MDRKDIDYEKVFTYLGAARFNRGKNYFPYYIDLKIAEDGYFSFVVESEREYLYYDVVIETIEGEIASATCTCPEYDVDGCCKHIAACLYHYNDTIFPISDEERRLLVSKSLLDEYYKSPVIPKVGLKKQAHLKLILVFRRGLSVFFEIGEDKLYSLSSKMSKFLKAYKNGEPLEFGKNFTYDPDVHFFTKEDEKIIRWLIEYDKRIYSTIRDVHLYDEVIDEFLDVLTGKDFYIDKNLVKSIEKGSPIKFEMHKEGNLYCIKPMDNLQNNKVEYLTKDFKYIRKGDILYRLSETESNVLASIEEVGSLAFEEDYLDKFVNGLLPIIKENVELDETVGDDVVISGKPDVKIYIDFKRDLIVGNIKFSYGDNIIDYFDTTDAKVVRDREAEMDVVQDLLSFNFQMGKDSFYIDDWDAMGYFLENDLQRLAEMYEVFSSNKIKGTNFLKDNHINTTFSIGKDNIMHYSFDFGSIDSGEVMDILDTLKRKKKYYRLKSGDFINLEESDELLELESLIDDMDMSKRDIESGEGEIPKYRAIYLDGLKKEKYHIVKTDNLFDEFIAKFNSYKNSTIDFSKKDLSILRDYQVEGVKWLYTIYKCGFGGILADEMGLGKSIQLIYFIKEVLKEKPDAKVLVVAPTSLIYNWKNEFDKFGSELKYRVVADDKKSREHILDTLEEVNVLITTYGLVRRDKESYENLKFEVVALDEAQNIKNSSAQMTKVVKKLNSESKFALTGTPLENSLLELWSIFDFLMPGYLAGITSFREKYRIKDVDDESLESLNRLKKQIDPFILRRKKKDVIKELPDKIENNIYIDLTDEQKKIYVEELAKTRKEMDEIIKNEGFLKANFKILQLLTKLRQLCIDPGLVYENYKGGSAKIENLVSITKDIIKNGHKILLFTSFKMALDLVNKEFTNNNISTYVIDGSVPSKKRMELVEKFNKDDTEVFLITLKSGGTGLNLTSADVVIHLDLWWNPQVENQATDRAHRIGQKNIVEVIKLVCRGTIEERILELQDKKRVLSDKLIEGDERDQNILARLDEEDIKGLLSMDNDDEE